MIFLSVLEGKFAIVKLKCSNDVVKNSMESSQKIHEHDLGLLRNLATILHARAPEELVHASLSAMMTAHALPRIRHNVDAIPSWDTAWSTYCKEHKDKVQEINQALEAARTILGTHAPFLTQGHDHPHGERAFRQIFKQGQAAYFRSPKDFMKHRDVMQTWCQMQDWNACAEVVANRDTRTLQTLRTLKGVVQTLVKNIESAEKDMMQHASDALEKVQEGIEEVLKNIQVVISNPRINRCDQEENAAHRLAIVAAIIQGIRRGHESLDLDDVRSLPHLVEEIESGRTIMADIEGLTEHPNPTVRRYAKMFHQHVQREEMPSPSMRTTITRRATLPLWTQKIVAVLQILNARISRNMQRTRPLF